MPDLNHLIVWCADKAAGAAHVIEILDLEPPRDFAGQFLLVDLGNGVSLDYADWNGGELAPQHLAFLVTEDEFDAAYGRIVANEIEHWAEPSKRTPGTINNHDGGRGVYSDSGRNVEGDSGSAWSRIARCSDGLPARGAASGWRVGRSD